MRTTFRKQLYSNANNFASRARDFPTPLKLTKKSACFSNITTSALSVSDHFEGHLLLLGTINIIKKADFVGTTNYQNTAQFSELGMLRISYLFWLFTYTVNILQKFTQWSLIWDCINILPLSRFRRIFITKTAFIYSLVLAALTSVTESLAMKYAGSCHC